MRSKNDHDLAEWTDAEIIHLLEGAGAVHFVLRAIKHPREIELDDPEFDDWTKPEYASVRRAAAESYLYGMYMADLSCKKWHAHCRDKY